MQNIYQAVYKCKALIPVGIPGYYDVVLGLSMVSGGVSDIVIKGTLSRFVVGKEYLINVMETP